MRRRAGVMSLIFIATLFLVSTAMAAKAPIGKHRVTGPSVDRAMHYSFPEEPRQLEPAEAQIDTRPSLGAPSSTLYAESPGFVMGTTWYDKQHNGSMGRMISTGYDAENGQIVHSLWMKLPTVNNDRHYRYNAWISGVGEQCAPGGVPVQPQGEGRYAGYCGIDVTPDNRAVAGGHENPNTGTYQSQFYWDTYPGLGNFIGDCRVPDALAAQGGINGSTEAIWPKF